MSLRMDAFMPSPGEKMFEHLLVKHAGIWSTRFLDFQCEEAWEFLVDETLTELRRISPAAKVSVVKEKFGRLTIYVEDKSDMRVRDLLRSVEASTAPPGEVDPC